MLEGFTGGYAFYWIFFQQSYEQIED
jgi:hypothetical protein